MSLTAKWSTCALCPRLCRTACPVATGAAREAAVPSFIAQVVGDWERDRASEALVVEAITLCTDCGACRDRCHIDRPLPQYLKETRAALLPPPEMAPLQPIEGDAELVAVQADSRPIAEALSQVLGREVAVWRTEDHFGVAAIEHPVWERRVEHLRQAAGSREIVVVDGGVAEALASAGIGFQWLHEVERSPWAGWSSCKSGGSNRPIACCGAAGPLARHHPDDAARVGRLWLERADDWRVADGRCRNHLRSCGGTASDPLDELLERLGLG